MNKSSLLESKSGGWPRCKKKRQSGKCNDSISAHEWFIVAAVCESCLEKRLEEERRSQLVYSRAAIYVRQVDKIGALTDNLMDMPSTLSSSIAEDPDFQVTIFGRGKTKIIPFSSCATLGPSSGKNVNIEFPHPFRSSIVWGLTGMIEWALLDGGNIAAGGEWGNVAADPVGGRRNPRWSSRMECK